MKNQSYNGGEIRLIVYGAKKNYRLVSFFNLIFIEQTKNQHFVRLKPPQYPNFLVPDLLKKYDEKETGSSNHWSKRFHLCRSAPQKAGRSEGSVVRSSDGDV
jgi:hypothetical protein